MDTLQFSTRAEIAETHAKLKAAFHSGITLPLSYRRHQLLQLARLIQDNIVDLEDALLADLHKPRLECTMTELGPIISSAVDAANKLEEWTKPEKPVVDAPFRGWDVTVYKAPKGLALIIGPWNYPYILTLKPLIGAIAAGCTCVVKPSELVPIAARLMADLLPQYLDPSAYVIINGSIDEATHLLSFKWDHIFFTGSSKVGRIVSVTAAKSLTPVTLELGGKPPVVIDEHCDLNIAARRILWGKLQNSGQLCVSPDYVLVPKYRMEALTIAFKCAYAEFWPKPVFDPEMAWGKMVSPAHHARVKDMIMRTKGAIIIGGQFDGVERIAPTIISDVKIDDSLMEDEIFGPVLPLLPVDNVDEAIQAINNGICGTPLVIYLFSNCEATKQKFLDRTRSGALILNDTISQVGINDLPFGGFGESGNGAWYGKDSFDTFTHRRSFSNAPPTAEHLLSMRYPPYTPERYHAMTAPARIEIPNK